MGLMNKFLSAIGMVKRYLIKVNYYDGDTSIRLLQPQIYNV
ncbi:MAG: hypothetical protein ACI9JO_000804 [Psychrobacter okhotskensis]|jgi:hypothetical protein